MIHRFFATLLSVLACLLSPAISPAQSAFTLAIIPDTQWEVMKPDDDRLPNRLHWLVDHRAELNLAMVMQVGDLENWDSPDHDQYRRASDALAILDDAGVPYALTTGNHDTAAMVTGGGHVADDLHGKLRDTTRFNAYHTPQRSHIDGQTYEPGKIDNAFRTFHAGGLDWLLINLECWPRSGAIDWAKGVIQSHPHHNVILLTHALLTGALQFQSDAGGYGDTSGQALFDTLVKPYPNVKLVFSGHDGTQGRRDETGSFGNTIHLFLQTFHERNTNPVRLLTIDPAKGTMVTWVYCPSTDKTTVPPETIAETQWIAPAGK